MGKTAKKNYLSVAETYRRLSESASLLRLKTITPTDKTNADAFANTLNKKGKGGLPFTGGVQELYNELKSTIQNSISSFTKSLQSDEYSRGIEDFIRTQYNIPAGGGAGKTKDLTTISRLCFTMLHIETAMKDKNNLFTTQWGLSKKNLSLNSVFATASQAAANDINNIMTGHDNLTESFTHALHRLSSGTDDTLPVRAVGTPITDIEKIQRATALDALAVPNTDLADSIGINPASFAEDMEICGTLVGGIRFHAGNNYDRVSSVLGDFTDDGVYDQVPPGGALIRAELGAALSDVASTRADFKNLSPDKVVLKTRKLAERAAVAGSDLVDAVSNSDESELDSAATQFAIDVAGGTEDDVV